MIHLFVFFLLLFIGAVYEGLAFQRGNCGVSIMRSGKHCLMLLQFINMFIPYDSIEVLCASSSGKSMESLKGQKQGPEGQRTVSIAFYN